MRKAVIVIAAEMWETAAVTLGVNALRQAMIRSDPTLMVEVCSLMGDAALVPSAFQATTAVADEVIWCPLTLEIPETWVFPGQKIYPMCRDVWGLRAWVERQFQCPTGEGALWLPVVVTAKGPVYGEVIYRETDTTEVKGSEFSYRQPLHLSDEWRQRLYRLGYRLLQALQGPPATYLIQFGLQGQTLIFDRLWPFPTIAAVASFSSQTPDLFTCHGYCLTNMPIYDIRVLPSVKYHTYSEND